MSSPAISDDDNSFEQPRRSTSLQGSKKPESINISSDEDSDKTIEYDGVVISSDEDEDLPNVQLPSKIDEQKDKIIKNLFPASGKAAKSKNGAKFTSNGSNVPPSGSASVSYDPPKPQPLPGHLKMIGGVPVHFPVPPYGAQIALMSKVIEGINKGVNCLLESPTGSGKTLALLCGALAWQQHEKNRIGNFQAQQLVSQHPELVELKGAAEGVASPAAVDLGHFAFQKEKFGEKSIYDKPGCSGAGDGPAPTTKRAEPHDGTDDTSEPGLVSIHKRRKVEDDVTPSLTPLQLTPEKQNISSPVKPETPKNIRVPTIYYGARTHKQIQQVVKEFSRTAYCGEATMTILSSREYSCIRPFDRSLYASKNDMCKECVSKRKPKHDEPRPQQEASNCKYYENRARLTAQDLPPAFDLEELVAVGRERNACPFYAARAMAAGANIVFCPYNYLIDPSIRSSLQIELQDEIVILDEAHNIEDICRDAATFLFSRDQIFAALQELEKLAEYRYANEDIQPDVACLIQALRNWNDWFANQAPLILSKPVNGGEAVHTWDVKHFVDTLNNHNIGIKQYGEFRGSAESFCRKLRDEPAALYGVAQATGNVVEAIGIVLSYLFREDGKQMDDFKPALIRGVETSPGSAPDAQGWRSTQYERSVQKETLSLRLMCMSPAVVFSQLSPCRTVLLASGTLTPRHSLASELGAAFPLQVSPGHVIAADRVWIGTLTTCPNGKPLECKSAAMNQVETQDALGQCVLWSCQVAPHGVLCFLPSYMLLNKLQRRWQETGLWRKLNDAKNVFMESRNVKEHNEIMEEYYATVGTPKGALLFAVYRGKVSEGMDFKDHQARAVITVGIPYPNTFDMMVREKMQYNDRHTRDKQLLSSSEWLRVQAYRALNQAVGRCVRHRRDWGAVLLVDARFTQRYYTEHLSQWVNNFLGNNHNTFEELVNSDNGLERFMQTMTMKEKEEDAL
ncbi:Fanconi anemia group J protein homolog isoform X3 [Plutella xylostella]|uniref:Fanconi anemia group J protein homolog isoform X3 n=1 Tax=Plutella xylostella TaxID=51655 RepID=UPI0020326491|nr:Fanconi anemia group J protein homolog isoform X3 [Plutella xylostella]